MPCIRGLKDPDLFRYLLESNDPERCSPRTHQPPEVSPQQSAGIRPAAFLPMSVQAEPFRSADFRCPP